MRLSSSQILARLGAGEKISAVCEAAGISREEFSAWWKREISARVPSASGSRRVDLRDSVRIVSDQWGIPHVFADNDEDLFCGFGYAIAQDRLFQLDYLRRRAVGRLSEILGPEGLELDLIARTVGLHLVAEQEWQSLPDETRRLGVAFAKGINAQIKDCAEKLPIEFDLLGYRPEPWRPQDSLAIAAEFRWYLTGRFPVIVLPELAKRALGQGPLYDAFLLAEADAEAILPPGSYPVSRAGTQPVGVSINDPAEGHGSNNWVVSGAKATGGKPMLASDPHIAFGAVSCWYEVHLCGGSFNVAGMAYAGMPAVMFGRNEKVAWGITNNICSQRDLYQEQTDAAHPGCFQFDGKWEPARERVEVIEIKGQDPLRKAIRLSRNGPIVDEILPPAAKSMGPVSLRWLGTSPCGWLTALLGMDRANSGDELRSATEPWLVPTFNVVYADVAGQIGYQCSGRIPIRNVWERGYRPGWDPAHQWAGLIPFEGLPHTVDPPRGWIATANNRVAADDFPYPLSGTWANGYRAVRLRQILEGKSKFDRDDFARMHQDSLSLRAVDCVPRLLNALQSADIGDTIIPPLHKGGPGGVGRASRGTTGLSMEPCHGPSTLAPSPPTPLPRGEMGEESHTNLTLSARRSTDPPCPPLMKRGNWGDAACSARSSAIEFLVAWDFRMEPDRVAASIFNVFFTLWTERVAAERFSADAAALAAGAIGGLAAELLVEDRVGWFRNAESHVPAIVHTFDAALGFLGEKLGPDMLEWSWGRLHMLQQKHILSGRGDLAELLDIGRMPVRGDYVTVCNTGLAPDYSAPTGAGYRLIADLSDPHGGLWAIEAGSQSGHPGSPHYNDQIGDWLTARYHYLPLKKEDVLANDKRELVLNPGS